MEDHTHVEVTRIKTGLLRSSALGRRQSVPASQLTGIPQVIKLPRDSSHHQSLKIQNIRPSEKVSVRRVSIIQKSIPPSINTHTVCQKPIDANDTLQSVSILILDANDTNKLQQRTITNNLIRSSVSIQNKYPYQSSLSQPRQNKCNDLINHSPNAIKNPNLHQASPTINIRPIKNSQNLIINHLNDNGWPGQTQSYHNQQKYRNKKQGLLKYCCTCSPLCCLLSIIGLIVLTAIIAGIVVALLPTRKTTITTITTTTTTTASTSTTTSVSTTSTSTTSTTVTTTTVTTVTSTTATTATTTIPCSPSCSSQQICVEGVCVNVGYLGCSLTWSRPGDGDIVVTTPNNRTIDYLNRGPTNTDGGVLDRDDTVNTGPENVYWPTTGAVPPTGTYYICFEPYSINPTISITDPITVIYRIMRQSGAMLVFTRTFTSVLKNSYNCDSTSITLVGSFTYP